MEISIGKKTDIGCVREINEDCYFVEISQNLGAQLDAPNAMSKVVRCK